MLRLHSFSESLNYHKCAEFISSIEIVSVYSFPPLGSIFVDEALVFFRKATADVWVEEKVTSKILCKMLIPWTALQKATGT